MTRTIELADPDPGWGHRFETERGRLHDAFEDAGVDDEVLAIEHVGSTAVPGLAAKPVLDVMIAVGEWPPSPDLIRTLVDLGYHHVGEAGMAGRTFLLDAPPDRPRSRHVHVVEHDSWYWRQHLLFRDHLRRRPEDAVAYEHAKRDLAARFPHDPAAYTDGKTQIVRDILARARTAAGAGRIEAEPQIGFDRAADVYDRVRPDYPAAAIRWLAAAAGIAPGSTVVDLGAGTGRLTRHLVRSGATVTAVEPVAGMRRRLRIQLPDVHTVDGTAEELPLPAASTDAVVAGQAFHWFDPWAALTEAYRVLREDGAVALIWNVRDDAVDWVARWTEILTPVAGSVSRHRTSRWRRAVEATTLYTAPRTATFPHAHELSREEFVDLVASTSFVAALDEDRRTTFLRQIRGLIDTHPQTRDLDTITVPYRTEVHAFARRE